jgi:hypothetical protein
MLAKFQYMRGTLTRTCEEQLRVSEEVINSSKFTDQVHQIVEKAAGKLKKDTGMLYYTG